MVKSQLIRDGSYTFTPDKDYNGPVQFTYEIHDEHGASVAQTASMNLAAVGDAALITGIDTGDVHENQSGQNMSPDHAQPGMSRIVSDHLSAAGILKIADPDMGENTFDIKGGAYNNSYHGQYGHLIINSQGQWHYAVTTGSHDWSIGGASSSVGSTIDQLGTGQTLTDTITVFSKDGTAHDIVITIHGDNDQPYCSSEVHLNTGTEDTAMTLTVTQLLANTVDVDSNDAGQLTIQNLRADHGSILINPRRHLYIYTDKRLQRQRAFYLRCT